MLHSIGRRKSVCRTANIRSRPVRAYFRSSRRQVVRSAAFQQVSEAQQGFTMGTERKVAVITSASQGIGAALVGLARAHEASNRPQTVYGIEDSPVGLAAWVLNHDARSYASIARVFAGQPEGLLRDDILAERPFATTANRSGIRLLPRFPDRHSCPLHSDNVTSHYRN
jgi:hypothetical protein